MASKRPNKQTGGDRRRDAKAILKLSRHAEREIKKLLKRNRAGTITRTKMESELKEIKDELEVMILYMHKFL